MRSERTDEGVISITKNLDTALRHLRHKDEPRLIWIDALCIDQTNDEEKSKQVAVMGRIFSLASRVVIWLGREEDSSSAALELLHQLARNVEVDWRSFTMRPSSQNEDPHLADFRTNLPYKSGELDRVSALLKRPYFERTWIRQEIVLAAQAMVQCGQHTLPWDEFRSAIACIYWKGYNYAALSEVSGISFTKALHTVFRICRMGLGGYRYSIIRRVLRDAKCSDDRDKIYAVASLLDKDDQKLGVKPDYTRTVEDLYLDLACRIINKGQTLTLLESCELSSKVLNIPSWVPDWSSRMTASNFPFTNWSACGWISAQATVIDKNKVSVAGVLVSRVEQVTEGKIIEYSDDYSQKRQLIRELRPSVQALASWGGSFSKSVELHCRALVSNTFSDFYYPERQHNPDFEANRLALFQAWMSDPNGKEFEDAMKNVSPDYWSVFTDQLIGRSFFSSTDNRIGLAPVGTQPGDVISVLLGCRYPVVLRPSGDWNTGRTWQVVGVCHVHGLMTGEAIYGSRLPSSYRSVERRDRQGDVIDGYRVALLDGKTNTFKADPANILTDMGIKVEKYTRYPHLLKVSPDALRAAGVALQDLTLV